MTNLQELIETTNKLSQRLEQAANDERAYCIDLQMRFEQLSWELYRMSNELQEIRYNYV